MSKPYDASLNDLIQEHATDWGHYLARRFGLPLGPVTTLNTNLSKTQQADQLFRIDADQPYCIHLELESGHEPGVPFDLLRYNIIAEDFTQVHVCSILLELRPSAHSPDRTGFLELGQPGHIGYKAFHYGVIKIWESKFAELLSVPGLIPLSILTDEARTSFREHWQTAYDQIEATVPDSATAKSLLTSMYFLSGLRYSTDELAKLLEGLTVIYQDSSTYQAVAANSFNRGEVERTLDLILRLGTKRLGQPSSKMQAWLQNLHDLEHLDRVFDAVQEVSTWEELAQVQ